MLPYDTLDNPRQYLTKTYLGARTAGYQAALGCRFRCTFCGVATMYRGKMALPPAQRLEQDLQFLRDRLGVDAIQFYDHNFFDREVDMVPLQGGDGEGPDAVVVLARSDALANLSERSWTLVKKSRLRMAYIGAESPSDWLLHDIRKGTRCDQTLAAIEQCRRHGVIPELSFMLAPPQDPEGETERTFDFMRSADEWAQPHWVRCWCHKDAPWLSPRLRRRIIDFTTVLGCRFPGQVRTARAGLMALPLSALCQPLGAARLEKAHTSVGSAGPELVNLFTEIWDMLRPRQRRGVLSMQRDSYS